MTFSSKGPAGGNGAPSRLQNCYQKPAEMAEVCFKMTPNSRHACEPNLALLKSSPRISHGRSDTSVDKCIRLTLDTVREV